MRQLSELASERDTMSTVVELTGAFEGIASMHISQIRDQVLASQIFFNDLWQIYSQIRVDEQFHFGREEGQRIIKKDLILLVTSEGNFSGDIDQRVVDAVVKTYDPSHNEIIVVGTHGSTQISQRNVPFVRSFRLPQSDSNFNVMPLVALVQQYKSTNVFYPTYISLTRQEVKSIQMSSLVTEKGSVAGKEDTITEANYIFEPSTYAVVDHLERSMINIMLSDIILESKLAQYASRFRAMHAARDKADETFTGLVVSYNQFKRRLKDERSKEVLNGLRRAKI